MRPVATVHEAIASIDAHRGRPEDFSLSVAASLLDPVGIHMAWLRIESSREGGRWTVTNSNSVIAFIGTRRYHDRLMHSTAHVGMLRDESHDGPAVIKKGA